ncbi:DNA protecting protein DprA [Thermosporothrix hazakensis]|jgi:DNA protecting protein DprA|uniref:DNA protecting protein DprA n=1 Tax=Thermosporothrix hazakensis TaxID=644383 RepID=A0A326UAK2_THEHA|nr:DNA-processing protein DprA [Thermosporothrix hazakensis]PZW32599.1 DNA protecting protein DprA [Thermosporothrix hazakensis]GCE49953.1 hypothetical protein KTH_48220 [Thermosporothrix hazakensis]
MNAREQACWFALVFQSKLPIRVINTILVTWCKQAGRTIEDLFAAEAQEWARVCHLTTEGLQKLEQARETIVAQSFLVEQLQHSGISVISVLDEQYPETLKLALDRNHIPPLLFYAGQLDILKRQTVAIIGSRNANAESLHFTRLVARYLAEKNTNVISGFARGVDRTAYEGATEADGPTTIVLPQGIRKLSRTQLRELQPRIEAGKVLLLSQFHPDAPWLVSRAMERNKVVTGLAQIVIVAESDTKGGTWEGANGALHQKRRVYVRATKDSSIPAGNAALLEKGARPLSWSPSDEDQAFAPLLEKARKVQEQQRSMPPSPRQLSLLAIEYKP